MSILITGGEGFIGTWLRRELSSDYEVYSLDTRDGDLREPGVFHDYMNRIQPDTVIHLAAQVGRLFGEDNIINSIQSNAQMTALVSKACGEYNSKLIYASTSEIYGDQGEALCKEEEGPFGIPHNIYGLSKRWGEEAARLYAPNGLLCIRFSMPYGPGVPPGRGRAALPNILWQAYNRLNIPIHKGAERSWCWIGDTVRAVRLLIEKDSTGAFNIGRDDDPRLLRDLAEVACDMVGADRILIKDVDPPEAQTVVKRLATEKIRDLGWSPTVDISEGMQHVLEWVKHFDGEGNWRN